MQRQMQIGFERLDHVLLLQEQLMKRRHIGGERSDVEHGRIQTKILAHRHG
jgi:hypothetical protein